KTLGANIGFPGNEGFPPLRITGPFEQQTNEVTVQGNISSQYLSALLLIANSLPLGLKLHIEGKLTSRPYLEMTLAMLAEAGIQHRWEGNTIHIENQAAKPASLSIEPDWSAASYWYSIAALSEEADILLPGLKAS